MHARPKAAILADNPGCIGGVFRRSEIAQHRANILAPVAAGVLDRHARAGVMRVPFNDLRRVNAPHAAAFKSACERVIDRGAYVLGAEVDAFEREFAGYCGTAHCVGVANGSDALEIALRAVGVGAGERVATVANAAMYATLAIQAIGAVPRHVDVDERTLTMSPEAFASVAREGVRAVVVTHLYGRLAAIREIADIAATTGTAVIEDAAQAHGARIDGICAGAFGAAACFSFYPTKNLGALGDGGAITTSDPAIAGRARSLRQYGWDGKYRVAVAGGRNSRLDEMQAAMLRARLPALDAENGRRRQIVNAYATRLDHRLIRPPAPVDAQESVAHLAVVRAQDREALRAHLAECGIGSDVHYPVPDHRQAVAARDAAAARLPVTERACDEVLSLPSFPALTDAEVSAVIDACNAWRC